MKIHLSFISMNVGKKGKEIPYNDSIGICSYKLERCLLNMYNSSK